MEEYIEAEGIESKVIEAIMQTCSLDKDVSKQCLDFIKNNQEILSDEEFFQYSKLEEYETDGVSEFVSEEGEFYISLKKSTIILIILYLEIKIPGFGPMKEAAGLLGLCNLTGGSAKLDVREGDVCIMLELARHRKHGAEKTLLNAFNGECCNNQLECGYNKNGLCSCKEQVVERICEKFVEQGIVKKRGRRYFYVL